jgi:hypothetical protein
VRDERVRIEFIRVIAAFDLPTCHIAPKTFRHTFANTLQDANVHSLIRNELIGHSPASTFGSANGLSRTLGMRFSVAIDQDSAWLGTIAI